jgi:hypothetical protein
VLLRRQIGKVRITLFEPLEGLGDHPRAGTIIGGAGQGFVELDVKPLSVRAVKKQRFEIGYSVFEPFGHNVVIPGAANEFCKNNRLHRSRSRRVHRSDPRKLGCRRR